MLIRNRDVTPRAARPYTGRTVARAIATLGLVLLAAACSGEGSGPPSATGSGSSSRPAAPSTAPSAIAYSSCMRSHGVPHFPDPDSSGNLPKVDAQQLGVSSSRLSTAQQACQPLLPASGGTLNANSFRECVLAGDCPAFLVQQALTEMRNFAQCVRSHGVPNWPDPTIGPNGGPFFDLGDHGFSRQQARSAQVSGAQHDCEQEMPDVGGVPVG